MPHRWAHPIETYFEAFNIFNSIRGDFSFLFFFQLVLLLFAIQSIIIIIDSIQVGRLSIFEERKKRMGRLGHWAWIKWTKLFNLMEIKIKKKDEEEREKKDKAKQFHHSEWILKYNAFANIKDIETIQIFDLMANRRKKQTNNQSEF